MPLADRRSAGAFFTTSVLCDGAFKAELPSRSHCLSALDPACGAADLLLRCADRLPILATLHETLNHWGGLLHGVDINEEFVRLARARLVLVAAARIRTTGECDDLESYLPGLVTGDGLQYMRAQSIPELVVMNPPFGTVQAPAWYGLGKGHISRAAVFVSAWLTRAESGGELIAILPDVLRSGANYRRWRGEIDQEAHVRRVISLGRFAEDADIDVFLLHLLAGSAGGQKADWWDSAKKPVLTCTARPIVSVGTVVPHRDHERGPMISYITAANLPLVQDAPLPSETRRHDGPVFRAPFVAVRRTSRPGQKPRARATVIHGPGTAAAENHLIIVKPASGGLRECQRIARFLELSDTSDWLNHRLGGRHLTTTALRELFACRGQ